MLQMSCEEHDKIAAKSQFITHTIGRYICYLLHFITCGLSINHVQTHILICMLTRYNFGLLFFLSGHWQKWISSPHLLIQKAFIHLFNWYLSPIIFVFKLSPFPLQNLSFHFLVCNQVWYQCGSLQLVAEGHHHQRQF